MSGAANDLIRGGYGVTTTMATTVTEAVVEAAAPALQDIMRSGFGVGVQKLWAQLLALLGRTEIPVTKLLIGAALLFKIRNYPMAAYFMIPLYIVYEAVGWRVAGAVWEAVRAPLFRRAALPPSLTRAARADSSSPSSWITRGAGTPGAPAPPAPPTSGACRSRCGAASERGASS